MPAGDLTTIANAESWAGVAGLQTTPATDSYVARLIAATSAYIAQYLSRDLLSLGGQGYSSVASIGADAGGAFILLTSGLGVTADTPLGISPDLGASIADLLNLTRTSIVASSSPISFPSTVSKVYVASTTGFNVKDPVSVTVYRTYSEVHSGVGTSAVALNEWPLYPPLVSVALAGVPLIAGTPSSLGYTTSGGQGTPIILSYPPQFPRCEGNASAVYRAGYPSVPADLEQVCIELVGLKLKERERIGQTGKSIGGEHISFVTGPMTMSMKDYLRNYKRTVPKWR